MDTKVIELPRGSITIESLVGLPLSTSERLIIEATLKLHGGNKTRAARTLGICIRTLRMKLKGYIAQDEALAA